MLSELAMEVLEMIRAKLEAAALRYAMGGGLSSLDEAAQELLQYHQEAAQVPDGGSVTDLEVHHPEARVRHPRATSVA